MCAIRVKCLKRESINRENYKKKLQLESDQSYFSFLIFQNQKGNNYSRQKRYAFKPVAIESKLSKHSQTKSFDFPPFIYIYIYIDIYKQKIKNT